MKKLCLIIILNFFWFNLAVSSILIKDCKTVYPAGHFSSNPDNEVMGKFDGKKQYLINYEDGLVYYTGVATKFMLNLIEKVESEGLPTPSKAKVTNYNYKIQFIDKNEVVAIRIQEYEEPRYNHFEEITIDLKNYRISKRVFSDTEDGKVMINLGKKLIKNSPLSEICIKDGIYNISKASVETDSIPVGYLDALKNGCISAAKKNNNLDKARLDYCVCYSNWFKDNLNSDEFNNFLALSVEDKKKFIVKNKINTQCYKN